MASSMQIGNPIRPMHSGDLECIYAIYERAHLDEYAGEPTTFISAPIEGDIKLLALLQDCDIYVFDDGAIKGFVGAREERIIWLYVSPDYRGQGVGRQLIDFMLERLSAAEFIAISVVKSNQPALNLYQRKGFQVVGEFSFDYQGVVVKALGLVLIRTD